MLNWWTLLNIFFSNVVILSVIKRQFLKKKKIKEAEGRERENKERASKKTRWKLELHTIICNDCYGVGDAGTPQVRLLSIALKHEGTPWDKQLFFRTSVSHKIIRLFSYQCHIKKYDDWKKNWNKI